MINFLPCPFCGETSNILAEESWCTCQECGASVHSLYKPPELMIKIWNTRKKDIEKIRFNSLKGAKKHYCPDWDGLAIDENCPEFECCTCFNKQTKKLTEKEND